MAPSGYPKKNLVLVGEGFSYLVKPWDESQNSILPTFLNENTSVPLNNLNRMAKEGSSGNLMIEKWDFEGIFYDIFFILFYIFIYLLLFFLYYYVYLKSYIIAYW